MANPLLIPASDDGWGKSRMMLDLDAKKYWEEQQKQLSIMFDNVRRTRHLRIFTQQKQVKPMETNYEKAIEILHDHFEQEKNRTDILNSHLFDAGIPSGWSLKGIIEGGMRKATEGKHFVQVVRCDAGLLEVY